MKECCRVWRIGGEELEEAGAGARGASVVMAGGSVVRESGELVK